MTISFVLDSLIFMSLSIDHLTKISVACCIWVSHPNLHISKIVQSSTYLYRGRGVSKSLICARNPLVPILFPGGMPPLGNPISERESPSYFNALTSIL